MSSDPWPLRRADDRAAVSLKQHLEEKLYAVRDRLEDRVDSNYEVLTGELAHLTERLTDHRRQMRDQLAAIREQAAREHAEQTMKLDQLADGVRKLAEADHAQQVSVRTLLWVAGAVGGLAAFIAAVVMVVVQLSAA